MTDRIELRPLEVLEPLIKGRLAEAHEAAKPHTDAMAEELQSAVVDHGRIQKCLADAYAAAAPHHLKAGELLLEVEAQMATPKDFQAWVKGHLGLTVGKVRPFI